jgi:hypothetical protein
VLTWTKHEGEWNSMYKKYTLEKFKEWSDSFSKNPNLHQVLLSTEKSCSVIDLSKGSIDEHWLDEEITELMQNDFPELTFCLISSIIKDLRMYTLFIVNDGVEFVFGGSVEESNPKEMFIGVSSFRNVFLSKEKAQEVGATFIKHLVNSPFLKSHYESGALKVNDFEMKSAFEQLAEFFNIKDE